MGEAIKAAKGLRSVKFSSEKKDKSSIPEGATILSTETNIDVEEIENGFLICRNTQTKYQAKGKDYNDWSYETKKWYSETNPLEIDTDNKELADLFD